MALKNRHFKKYILAYNKYKYIKTGRGVGKVNYSCHKMGNQVKEKKKKLTGYCSLVFKAQLMMTKQIFAQIYICNLALKSKE